MAGTQLTFDIKGFAEATHAINGLGGNAADIYVAAGALIESQTRRRIAEEKTGPDGNAWAAWSPEYEATRKSGQSLLMNEGELLDSIAWAVSGDDLEVGSNLVYAATHQFGSEDGTIPARPFLGLSADNENELLELVTGLIAGDLQ